MGGLPRPLADRLVSLAKHTLVGLPEAAVGVGGTVSLGDAHPKLASAVYDAPQLLDQHLPNVAYP